MQGWYLRSHGIACTQSATVMQKWRILEDYGNNAPIHLLSITGICPCHLCRSGEHQQPSGRSLAPTINDFIAGSNR